MGDYVGGFHRDRMFYYMDRAAYAKYLDSMNAKSKIMRSGRGGLSGYYLRGPVARGDFYLAVFSVCVFSAPPIIRAR